MPEGFRSFADIIKTDPRLENVRNTIAQSDVVVEFNKIFPDLCKVAVAVKVDKKVLHLKVENASWRNELKFKENIIVEKVNEFYNEEVINRVKFVS